ncbi:hypothetical protein PIB30_098911, partial [Stylosanthes scabra]|nr:hypothetical protein [Stylosanthes scabra]
MPPLMLGVAPTRSMLQSHHPFFLSFLPSPSPCYQSHVQASFIQALMFAPPTHVTFGVPSPQ